jgi:hypothetical protein
MGEDMMRKHGVYCGSRLPPLITSEGNSLRVEFNSDNSVQKSGFAAVFFTGNSTHNVTYKNHAHNKEYTFVIKETKVCTSGHKWINK